MFFRNTKATPNQIGFDESVSEQAKNKSITGKLNAGRYQQMTLIFNTNFLKIRAKFYPPFLFT
jgi:hypothetical protein